MTALSWVRNRKVKSELKRDAKTENAWRLVDRALIWLAENPKHNPVYKWETEAWGENPADYGRK
jgi:ribonuclease HI